MEKITEKIIVKILKSLKPKPIGVDVMATSKEIYAEDRWAYIIHLLCKDFYRDREANLYLVERAKRFDDDWKSFLLGQAGQFMRMSNRRAIFIARLHYNHLKWMLSMSKGNFPNV